MYLLRLTLQNYRNYEALELPMSPGVSLFTGDNAQGKTNLLESIYLLATTRTPRSNNDSDLVRWGAAATESPVARIEGHARRRGGEVAVTIAIGLGHQAGSESQKSHTSKRLQVNGIPRRASDVVGQIAVVLFTAQDIDLLTGPPALRRRYLDVTISQVNPLYLRSLQRYSRILLQRNSLLRQLQEATARPDQLEFWDQELAGEAASILMTRATATSWLADRAAASHDRLSHGQESLGITYQPQLPPGLTMAALELSPGDLREQLLFSLKTARQREIAAGVSLFGPHRDELLFTVNSASAASFGSRAQQRTAALALRLAETAYIEAEAGDQPVLLLDDILSELDKQRRQSVLEALGGVDQILITATELDEFAAGALAASRRYRSQAGQVRGDA